MRNVLGALVLIAWACGSAAAADKRVDLELVLLADASRSIDDAEIRFQRQGYGAAIADPAVLAAITQGYERQIAVIYVEWGNELSQEVVVPWTIIDGEQSAQAFADALLKAPGRASGMNAIGSAIAVAHDFIETNKIRGHRKVIDISADSANSFGGIPIHEARAAAIADEIVINGLAVLCRDCSGPPVTYDLAAAFRRFIIGGPGSFVVTATGDDGFAEAVRKKLLLEIADLPGGNRREQAKPAPARRFQSP